MSSRHHFLAMALVIAGIASSAHSPINAQGLIGAPDHSQRPITTRLELERARLYNHGLKDMKTRIIYGSIVWELAEKYELQNRWQDAIAAQNTFKDLKLPPNAMADCNGCLFTASDEMFKIDTERLQSKISAIESVDHKKFDKEKRLPVPRWKLKEKRQYELITKTTQLRDAYATTVNKLLKD